MNDDKLKELIAKNEILLEKISIYATSIDDRAGIAVPYKGQSVVIILKNGNLHLNAPIINYGYPINHRYDEEEKFELYSKAEEALRTKTFVAPSAYCLSSNIPLRTCEKARRINRPMEMVEIEGYSDQKINNNKRFTMQKSIMSMCFEYLPDVLKADKNFLEKIFVTGYGSYVDNKTKENYPFLVFEVGTDQLMRSYESYVLSLKTLDGTLLNKFYGGNAVYRFEDLMLELYSYFNSVDKLLTPDEAREIDSRISKIFYAYERATSMYVINRYSSSYRSDILNCDYTVVLNEVAPL